MAISDSYGRLTKYLILVIIQCLDKFVKEPEVSRGAIHISMH